MSYETLEQNFRTGLSLVRDHTDPPRYYIKQGRRLELIAIGNEGAGRTRFAVRCSRARQQIAAAHKSAVPFQQAGRNASPRDVA